MAEETLTGVPSRWGATYMAAWDGGETRTGRVCGNAWAAAAAACGARGIDPILLVDAAFTPPIRPLPEPNQLISEELLGRASRAGKEAAGIAEAALSRQRAVLRGEVDFLVAGGRGKGEAVRRALTEPGIQLSGLFRYCYAALAGDADLAAHFADEALYQYAFRAKAYDDAWGDLVTDYLRQRARTFFD